MLKNYLKVAFRNLLRRKGYTALNVAGLGLGIAVCLIVGLTVRHEWSYDRFHPESERLYRVVQDVSWSGGMQWDWTTPVMAPTLAAEVPEVEATARFHRLGLLVSREDMPTPLRFQEDDVAFVDPSFFDLFAFPLVAGDADALAQPKTVVLTEATAQKYFGDENPVGRTLSLGTEIDVEVVGVAAALPTNTDLDFDFAVSFATLPMWMEVDDINRSWWWPYLQTYVRLAPGADVETLNAETLPSLVARHREPHFAEAIHPRVQAIGEIHLYGNPGGNAIRFVSVFSAIALFVLLIACVNYVNLATARATRRAREVGVRKTLGAKRGQLIGQFLGESVLVVAAALTLAVAVAASVLPAFSDWSGRALTLDGAVVWGGLALVGVAVALVAGAYPAFVLSRFSPVKALRGRGVRAGGVGLRRGLVVLQFAVSIVLIVGTLVVYRQVDYLQTASLGFEKEEVVALRLREEHGGFDALKQAIEAQPGVVRATASTWYPGVGGETYYATTLDGEEMDDDPAILHVGPDFLETLGLEVVAGRGFDATRAADRQAFLLNESAVNAYELDDPLAATLHLVAAENGVVSYEREGPVVGVVKDFNLTKLSTPIYPAALALARPDFAYPYALVRLAPGDPRAALDAVEGVWADFFPTRPFEFSFVDDRLDALYADEVQFGQTVGVLGGLAIFIACLGLFGLAAYAAEQRTKEIGIRKTLGATVPDLIVLLARDFVVLVAAAALVAAPVAYLAMDRWLDDFAYRVDLGPLLFVGAGLVALVIALATVSGQAFRAATADPVEALRSE